MMITGSKILTLIQKNLVVVALPQSYLEFSVQNFNKPYFKIAAQNVSKFNNPGAYTGQMSSAMFMTWSKLLHHWPL